MGIIYIVLADDFFKKIEDFFIGRKTLSTLVISAKEREHILVKVFRLQIISCELFLGQLRHTADDAVMGSHNGAPRPGIYRCIGGGSYLYKTIGVLLQPR